MSGEVADLLAVNDADAARTRPRVARYRALCPAVPAEDLDDDTPRLPGTATPVHTWPAQEGTA